MNGPYSPVKALREAVALAGTNAFAEFHLLLEQYVQVGSDEHSLRDGALAMAMESKRRAIPPERVLHALRLANCSVASAPMDTSGTLADRRYHHALNLFLLCYYVT